MRNEDHRLYSTWKSMKTRCNNPNAKSYHRYGGRGIDICPEWQGSFTKFVEDMYPTYQEGLTLDRVNNDLGYSPENCQWATRKQQMNNTSANLSIEYEGSFYTEAEICDKFSITRTTFQARRVKGWSIKECIEGKSFKSIKFLGIWYNQREFADFCGISPQLLNKRLREKGQTIEEIYNEFNPV